MNREPILSFEEWAPQVDRAARAIWIYPLHGFWALKAEDGEILASLQGSAVSNLWSYKGKEYHGLDNAKKAVMRSLGVK